LLVSSNQYAGFPAYLCWFSSNLSSTPISVFVLSLLLSLKGAEGDYGVNEDSNPADKLQAEPLYASNLHYRPSCIPCGRAGNLAGNAVDEAVTEV
jgi:hypothetical protein